LGFGPGFIDVIDFIGLDYELTRTVNLMILSSILSNRSHQDLDRSLAAGLPARRITALHAVLFAAYLVEFALIYRSYQALGTLFQTYPAPAHPVGLSELASFVGIPLVAVIACSVYVGNRWLHRARQKRPVNAGLG
jgi:hypothetical protein